MQSSCRNPYAETITTQTTEKIIQPGHPKPGAGPFALAGTHVVFASGMRWRACSGSVRRQTNPRQASRHKQARHTLGDSLWGNGARSQPWPRALAPCPGRESQASPAAIPWASGSSPAARSIEHRRIKGRPTRAVGSSPSIDSNRATPSPSDLNDPAQSKGCSRSR